MKNAMKILTILSLLVMVIGLSACGDFDLEVQNGTVLVLDIYIDDFYEGSVAPGNYLLVRELSSGDHFAEAIDLNGKVVAEEDIYLDDNSIWVIND